MEAGDTRFFVSRGYVHVIGSPRGMHKSEDGGSREIGQIMTCFRVDRTSAVVRRQCGHDRHRRVCCRAVQTGQAALTRISRPYSPTTGAALTVRSAASAKNTLGGVIHSLRYLMDHFLRRTSEQAGAPATLAARGRRRGREAMSNPDYGMYPHVLNVLQQKGEHMPQYFDILLDPYDHEEIVRESESGRSPRSTSRPMSAQVGTATPTRCISAARRTTAQCCSPAMRLVLTGPAHLDRPLRALRAERTAMV